MKKRTKRFHYSTITLAFTFGVILGLICFSFFDSFGSYLNYLLIVLFLFFSTLNAFVFRGIGRFFFAIIAGLVLAFLRYQSINKATEAITNTRNQITEIELEVSSEVSHKNNSWRFGASRVVIDGEKSDCLLYVSLPEEDPKPQRGDRLKIKGKILDGFGEYAGYLARPTLIELSKPDPPDYSLVARDAFANRLKTLIGDNYKNEAALGLGYLTGQKDSISEDFNDELRCAELAHVVVASGFHLGLIANLAKRLFRKVSRFASYAAAFVSIIIFISVTGFSASMLRAGLVIGMTLFASYFGRKLHPARLLLYAAAISLLYRPQLLLNVGWQLSFASFAGLLFFAPLIQDYFFGEDIGVVASSLIQTVSAQLFCLPISIYTFGNFSPIGLLSNLLVPPTIPLVMFLCFTTVVCSFVPEVGALIAYFARQLLSLHVGIIEYLSHFNWASISLKSGNSNIFLLYIPLIMACLFLKWRTKHHFRPQYAKLSSVEKSQKDGKIYSC